MIRNDEQSGETMNITITPNLFNASVANPYFHSGLPSECYVAEKLSYTAECLYKILCPQFNAYFIRVGLILIISYIIMTWLLWWFFKYGYKKVGYTVFFGDFQLLETRYYWDSWIRARMSWAFLIYVVIVVWMAWGMR